MNIKVPYLSLFTIVLLIFCNLTASSQRFQAAIAGGFNTSNVQGDDVYGFRKYGGNAGIMAIVPFSDHLHGSLEIGFSQKGAYHKPGGRGMDYRKKHDYDGYKIILDYLEIPVLIHYQDKNQMNFGAGISFGRLVKVQEFEDVYLDTIVKLERIESTTLKGPYNQSDINAVFAMRFPIFKSLKFDARYTFSLLNIRERYFIEADVKRKQYNQVLTFRLLYVINEKASLKNRMENRLGK